MKNAMRFFAGIGLLGSLATACGGGGTLYGQDFLSSRYDLTPTVTLTEVIEGEATLTIPVDSFGSVDAVDGGTVTVHVNSATVQDGVDAAALYDDEAGEASLDLQDLADGDEIEVDVLNGDGEQLTYVGVALESTPVRVNLVE